MGQPDDLADADPGLGGGLDAAPSGFDADPLLPDASTSASDAASAGLATVSWNGRTWAWDTNATNSGYPRFNGSEVILTPNEAYKSAAILLTTPVSPPFTVEFDYLTYDTDGCQGSLCTYNSADGIVFMFGKDMTAYETVDPPVGAWRGFVSGSGVGVHFELYGDRAIVVRDSFGDVLAYQYTETYFSSWRHVYIDVQPYTIDVYAGSPLVLAVHFQRATPITTVNHTLGFGAATGTASAAEHRIRNVVVSF